jgi:hypothetical protein
MTLPARDGAFRGPERARRSVRDELRLCLIVPCDEPGEGKPAADRLPDLRAKDDGGPGAVLSDPGSEWDAGRAQELFCELATTACTELRTRAENGDEAAGRWLERILALGEQLGIRVALRPAGAAADLAAAVFRDALEVRRVPSATHRLQFNRNFTFQDARDLVPYLHALGISDCYASPVLQARAGSSHGYDICDHSRLSPDLGGE